ncbi:hypothetical protein ACPC54_23600 [Kitasatospora sp. NPDC094028]
MTTIQRRAADRLAAGTTIVVKRIGAALVPEQRPIATVVRCGGTAWLGFRLLDIAHHTPAVLIAGAGIWCLSAWRAGDPTAKPAAKPAEPVAADKAVEEPQGEEEEATEATEAVEKPDELADFITLLHHLMPGTTPGRNDRIHLAQIASAWGVEGADTAPIRALLARLNIPTTSCRVPDRGSSTGIYRRDVPPLPDPDQQPLPAVVGGPDQQQQQQQRSEVAAREGFWIKGHPDHPHRSIVEWEEAS